MTTARQAAVEARIRAIHEIESELDVADLRWEGVSYWPIVRRMIAYEGIGENRRATGTSTAGLIARGAASAAIEPALRIRAGRVDGPLDVFYLTHASCRMRRLDGRWVDAYFSALVEEARARRGVAIHGDEVAHAFRYRLPRHEATDLVERHAFWLAAGGRLARVPDLADGDRRLLTAAGALLRGAGMPAGSVEPARVAGAIRAFGRWRDHFARRLDVHRPRVVAIVTYYSMPGLALAHAANEAGIPSVDLQHGIQGAGHPMYAEWRGAPARGWTCLPSAFWVWTEADARRLESWARDRHRVVVGGNLMTTRLRDEEAGIERQVERLRRRAAERRSVLLVTLHPGHFADWNRRVLDLIRSDSQPDVFWLVRLHPAALEEVGRFERLLAGAPADVRLASELPLGDVLRLCDGHVTVTSTVAVDAAVVGVPSLVADSAVAFEDLMASGIVVAAATGSAVESAILDFAAGLGPRREGRADDYATTPAAALDLLLSLAAG